MSDIDEILRDARAAVAAGRAVDRDAVVARIRAAGGSRAAVARLERVLAIGRARTVLAREPEAPQAQRAPAAPTRRPGARPALKQRATITGNMDVRSSGVTTLALAWKPVPRVAEWEVRVSERPDPRQDYEVLDERTLAPDTTTTEVELSERARRVHILGRDRSGRLLARAIVSGLTLENAGERWQRKASAS